MGCGQSRDANADTEPERSSRAASSTRRKKRRQQNDEFTGVVADKTEDPGSAPLANNQSTPAAQIQKNAKQTPANAPPANPLQADGVRTQSLAPNSYAHIMAGTAGNGAKAAAAAPAEQPTNARPVVGVIGAEEKRRPFRTVLREALELAKAQRVKYGKFRKDEKHAVMELYDTIGLEEDTFLGAPNELQQRLSKYTYPPPNMHMLRENEIDEDIVEHMLGAEEAKRRKQSGFEVAPAAHKENVAVNGVKRRVGVSSEATATLQKVKIFKEKPKTKAQTQHLMTAMQKSVLFKGMDSRDMKILFDAFEQDIYEANSTIFEKGDEGDKFYLLETGRCQIVIETEEGQRSVFVDEGDTFGELGVMYGTPRAATVIAVLDSSLWWIDRDTYRGTLLTQTLRKRERYMKFMENVPILSTLEDYEKARIADVLEPQECKEGQVIVTENEPGDCFFIVEEGEVVVEKQKEGEVARLGAGKFFGEVALLFDKPRAATVTVSSSTARMVALSRINFANYLGPLEEKLRRNVDHYKQIVGKTRRTSSML